MERIERLQKVTTNVTMHRLLRLTWDQCILANALRYLCTKNNSIIHCSLHESLGCTSFGLRHLRSGERTIKGWYYLLNDDVGRKKHLHVATRERTPRPPSNPVYRVPAVNSKVCGMETVNITIRRSPYGGFGFTLVNSCPVKVGRVDSSSPAEAAGLQKDDIVVRVNYQNVSRSTSVSVAKCIK